MARRPLWSGSLTFGLVYIPVRLYAAVAPKGVHFHMLHDKDGGRIQQRRVCSVDGEEVPYAHVVKGYEVAKNQYVVVSGQELKQFEAKVSRVIEIESFVELAEIDPIYFASTYYLVPDLRAEKAYGLLTEALRRAQKAGVARVALRSRTSLCAVRVRGEALVLSTMNAPDELVSLDELEVPVRASSTPGARELGMAEELIASLSGHFQPERYHDEYREQLLAFIQSKAEGKQLVGAPEPAEGAPVVDLMDALKKSLSAVRPKKPPAPRRHRAEAARTVRRKG